MGRAYSRRFLLVAGNQSKSYSPPSGKRAVIRHISAVNVGSAAAFVTVKLNGFRVLMQQVAVSGHVQAAGLCIVVDVGDDLEILTGIDVTAQCSGHLLDV